MVLTVCLKAASARLAGVYPNRSSIIQSAPFLPEQLGFELTYALRERPNPNRLCGQQQSFLARLWLQIIPQGVVANEGRREQDLRWGAQSGWERRKKVSCRWMKNWKEGGYELPWAEHVHGIKSPIFKGGPLKRARMTSKEVERGSSSQRPWWIHFVAGVAECCRGAQSR